MGFVDFELAKKLKEKGFKEQCLAYYTNSNDLYFNYSHKAGAKYSDCYLSHNLMPKDSVSGKFFDAPTISQVLKWLRKYKEIYCLPYFEQGIDMWLYSICRPNAGCEFPEFISESIYNDYEEAALAGIDYALDNLV